MNNKNFYIDLIADYGNKSGINDLAFLEVKNSLLNNFIEQELIINNLNTLSTMPFNTFETGFAITQLGVNSKIKNHIVYHNCAPRKDDTNPRHNNAGEFLAVTQTNPETVVIGPNSGYSFSLLKNNFKIYKLDCPADGSQFRSRDIFPKAIAELAFFLSKNKNLESYPKIQEEITMQIPDYPKDTIAYIDGYGNLKTTIIVPDRLKEQEKLKIKINKKEAIVYFKNGIFEIQDNELVLAKGSSSFINTENKKQNFLEICLRSGNASEYFNHPSPGDKIYFL